MPRSTGSFLQTPASLSPFHTAPRQAKIYRSAHPLLFLPPAPATYTEMFRRPSPLALLALAPALPSSVWPVSRSTLASPAQNPAASLRSRSTSRSPASNRGVPPRSGAPYPAHPQSARRTSTPASTVEAPSPAASLAFPPPRTPSPDSPHHPDYRHHAARKC